MMMTRFAKIAESSGCLNYMLHIINTANFTPKNLKLAKYDENPLEDQSLENYQLIKADMTSLIAITLKDSGLTSNIIARSTNMFALGLLYWLYEGGSGV